MSYEEPGFSPESTDSRPGSPLEPRRVLAIVWRVKKWLVVGFCLGGLAGVLFSSYFLPVTYLATAVAATDDSRPIPRHEQQRAIATVLTAADSEVVRAEFGIREGMEDAPLRLLRILAPVEFDPSKGLFEFSGSGETPEVAARRANSMLAVLGDHLRREREQGLRVELESLHDRLRGASDELEKARRRYGAFRQSHGITNLTAEQEEVIGQTAKLRAEADMARTEAESLEGQVRQLEAAAKDGSRSPVRSKSQTRIRELEKRLSDAREEGLGESHPMIRSLSAQIEELESSKEAPATETRRVSPDQSLKDARTELGRLRARHASLEKLAEEAQARSKAFGAIEGEAAGLASDVSVKEALIDDLRKKVAGINDELRDVPTGFRVVSEASLPENPESNNKRKLVVAGLPLFAVLMLVAIFVGRELWGLRAFAPSEVAWWGNGPVVGTSTWPRLPGGWLDLVADVEDLFRGAQGTLLVVGVAEQESELADQLVEELNDSWGETVMLDQPVTGLLPADVADAEFEESSGSKSGPPGADTIFEPLDDADEEHYGSRHERYGSDGSYQDTVSRLPSGGPMEQEGRPSGLVCITWDHTSGLQGLRRMARGVDAVLVVVLSGVTRVSELMQVRERLGRDDRVAYLVVGASDEVARLRDRIGSVDRFLAGWAA